MSAPFLRPARSIDHVHCDPATCGEQNLRASVWARCDLCRWSGVVERFVVLEKGEFFTYVCQHQWCYGNAFVREQLEQEGWVRV